MKNFVQPGHAVPIIGATGGHLSGDLVIVGAMFGIAATNIAEAAEGQLVLGGVFELPKATGQSWAIGAVVYWDSTAKKATTTATNNTKIGVVALEAKINGDTTGNVRLNDCF